jgi:hypothetical protein
VKTAVVWIVGEPGVGKTTLSRALLKEFGGEPREIAKPKFTLFGDVVAAAGHWRGTTFDGADTLPISDIKPAIMYISEALMDREMVLLDGDKLANAGAVEALEDVGCKPVCFFLANPHLAVERRLKRGTNQNAVWVRGRRTKASNFYDRFPGYKQLLDPATDTEILVRQMLMPIAAAVES